MYLAHPNVLLELGHDVRAAWAVIMTERAGKQPAELRRLIAVAFGQRGILPSQVLDRLTAQPVAIR